jgi:glycosyltransferase involved in cell wall biosynthesis
VPREGWPERVPPTAGRVPPTGPRGAVAYAAAVVGVIVPVHGFPGYLAEALDCVLGQRPAPAAVVVVDDASPEPVRLHPDHAGRCTLLRREECGGPAAARASGLDALAPEVDVVALCDADDAWADGKLAAQLAALDEHADAGLCFGRAVVVGSDGRPTGERWTLLQPGRHEGAALQSLLYESNPIPTSSVVMRREALERAGGFASPVRLAEDWDLWLRLAARGEPFVCAPDAVVRYRRHPGGLTADVAALARCQLELHRTNGALVDPAVRERALAADDAALRSATRGGLRALLPRRDPYRR